MSVEGSGDFDRNAGMAGGGVVNEHRQIALQMSAERQEIGYDDDAIRAAAYQKIHSAGEAGLTTLQESGFNHLAGVLRHLCRHRPYSFVRALDPRPVRKYHKPCHAVDHAVLIMKR